MRATQAQPFAGGLYDPHTKLVRFGARDYDPQVGRWTGKDPVGFPDARLCGFANAYGYGCESPLFFLDPGGLYSISPTCRTVRKEVEAAIAYVCGLLQNEGCMSLLTEAEKVCLQGACDNKDDCKWRITCRDYGDSNNDCAGSFSPCLVGDGPRRAGISLNTNKKGSGCPWKDGSGFGPTLFHETLHLCGLDHGPRRGYIQYKCTGWVDEDYEPGWYP